MPTSSIVQRGLSEDFTGVIASFTPQKLPLFSHGLDIYSPVDLAAKRSIESKGMSSKVQIISGDMFRSIPEGFDIHLFANAFHDWDIDSL